MPSDNILGEVWLPPRNAKFPSPAGREVHMEILRHSILALLALSLSGCASNSGPDSRPQGETMGYGGNELITVVFWKQTSTTTTPDLASSEFRISLQNLEITCDANSRIFVQLPNGRSILESSPILDAEIQIARTLEKEHPVFAQVQPAILETNLMFDAIPALPYLAAQLREARWNSSQPNDYDHLKQAILLNDGVTFHIVTKLNGQMTGRYQLTDKGKKFLQ
jgi:hypothetical protein